LQPSSLDMMFKPGTRYALPSVDSTDKVHVVAVDVRRAGLLQLPSGRLVAAEHTGIACFHDPAVTAPMVEMVTDAWERFVAGHDNQLMGQQHVEVVDHIWGDYASLRDVCEGVIAPVGRRALRSISPTGAAQAAR
jgi:hypothetical protein